MDATEDKDKLPNNDAIEASYVSPKKSVLSAADMARWEKSVAYKEYLNFLTSLNQAVRGKSNSYECKESQICKNLITLLDELDKWVEEIPPIQQPQRFGNKAYRSWFERLKERSDGLLRDALPEDLHPAIIELSPYLVDGFGNFTRIDYGSGHEMSFLMFLCCLNKIGAVTADDKIALVLKVFGRYMKVVRNLQLTYNMEPAGSHGVWSLDDFQFVPFVWGSSQLISNPKIDPSLLADSEIVKQHASDYMFLACIQFILKVKTGPFAEHSNQLWNISAIDTWTKVNQGLIRMYKAEVLAKFPVIQHTLFGSILSFDPAPPDPPRLMLPPAAPPQLIK